MKIKLIYQNSTQNLSFIMVYHLKKILFFSSQCYIHVHVKLNKIMTSCKASYRLTSIPQHPRNVTKINLIFWKIKQSMSYSWWLPCLDVEKGIRENAGLGLNEVGVSVSLSVLRLDGCGTLKKNKMKEIIRIQITTANKTYI